MSDEFNVLASMKFELSPELKKGYPSDRLWSVVVSDLYRLAVNSPGPAGQNIIDTLTSAHPKNSTPDEMRKALAKSIWERDKNENRLIDYCGRAIFHRLQPFEKQALKKAYKVKGQRLDEIFKAEEARLKKDLTEFCKKHNIKMPTS